jgi:large subunit ribosomal protein L25
MLILTAKIRKGLGKKVKSLRQQGVLPAVLYGHKIKNLNLELDLKEFEKIYKEAGESSLITLNVEGEKEKFLVLIHNIQFDHLTEKPIHVDFYQPELKEEVEVTVPLIFEGVSPAVKDLGGTLVKNISEVQVKALPQNLPHEIKVDIGNLKTFEDNILIKDLIVLKEVKILKEPEEIVAKVIPSEKVEEELEKPVEEKVEEVEKVEKKPKKEEEEIKEEIEK